MILRVSMAEDHEPKGEALTCVDTYRRVVVGQ